MGLGRPLSLTGVLVLGALSLVFGRNFFSLVDGSTVDEPAAPTAAASGPDEQVEFVSFVLDDVQNTWEALFSEQNQPYTRAKLVLFTDAVRSGCGTGEAAMGPFYCPADQKAYIDLGFYRELKNRFGAPGDFAQAYVLAHEIGHHVQHLLGLDRRVNAARQGNSSSANRLQIALELQADCLAGVWAHSTQQRSLLEAGDVDEALAAAASVGDDRIQKSATGRVNPETWTHGSSEQRASWFRRGFQAGTLRACDTLSP